MMQNKKLKRQTNNLAFWGRSPGLVVMGGDSRPRGRGFESRYHILYGHFFTYIVEKIVMFV